MRAPGSRTAAFLAGALALGGAACLAATRRHRGGAPAVPPWLKLGYGTATPVIALVYRRAYGPANFLWLSDLALASTTLAVLRENRLLASMPAVGVLPLELAWSADFMAGGRLLDLAGYMFDRRLPRGLRALSLFHLALPPTLLWMLGRLGYDRRALPLQTLLTWAALLLSYRLTAPEQNINWAFGPGTRPQRALPPRLYLGLLMLGLPLLVFLPMHLLLRRAFGAPATGPAPEAEWHVR
ncbi:hypothetical protein QMO56_15495 [Roseomonas sp. E05]|uniref:hypothetical protein n=1 Tax=Roseomonas sp. E05 TaxID=3046310 RepID=UPI0024B8F030|nr:hypothetical protein [Roseomonas sp. E05]MDJ0389521.1 hypothetical protein [Roseomonas sp. E05]